MMVNNLFTLTFYWTKTFKISAFNNRSFTPDNLNDYIYLFVVKKLYTYCEENNENQINQVKNICINFKLVRCVNKLWQKKDCCQNHN